MDQDKRQKYNPWKWQIGHNPYKHNAFLISDVAVDETDPRKIARCISRRIRQVRRAPERAVVHGKKLSMSDVNQANGTLTDPNRRIMEELLCHSPHRAVENRCYEGLKYFSSADPYHGESGHFRITNRIALKNFISMSKENIFSKDIGSLEFPKQSVGIEKSIQEEIDFDL